METIQAAKIGTIARIALYLWILPEVVLLSAEAGALIDPQRAPAVATLSLVALFWLMATGIVVGLWIYRAMQVAHSLQEDLTITPGWAVGWYFVPVASFWKPYQAMREIWDASVVRPYAGDAGGATLLGWWWAAWLCRSIAGGLAHWIGLSVLIPSCIASIAAAVLLAEIIRRISESQSGVVDARIFA